MGEVPVAWNGAVATEREGHAAAAGHAGHGAEKLAGGGDEQYDPAPAGGERLGEHHGHAAATRGYLALVLDGEKEREQQYPPTDARVEDRPPDALGCHVGRAPG